ncbi:MAG: hypothetical protein AB8C84_05485 [Oligoflexales bacterium]
MDNGLAFCIAAGVLFLLFVLSPFWMGVGGELERASVIDDLNELLKLKSAVLQRYLQEEKDFVAGHLTNTEWNRRKEFLEGRYLDYARRLDYLNRGVDS